MRKILTGLFLMLCVSQAAIGQIDIHSHAITDGYMAAVKDHGIEMDECYPIPSWNVESHLKFMDEAGIQTSVLTMPAPQPVGKDAALVCRAWNEECAGPRPPVPSSIWWRTMCWSVTRT